MKTTAGRLRRFLPIASSEFEIKLDEAASKLGDEMRRQSRGLWRAGAVVAIALAIPDAAWAVNRTYAVECAIVPPDNLVVRNTTGRVIPAWTRIEITSRTKGGVLKNAPGPANYIYNDLAVGGTQYWIVRSAAVVSCTATVSLPADLQGQVRKKREIPKYSLSRPPGPPIPGIRYSVPGR